MAVLSIAVTGVSTIAAFIFVRESAAAAQSDRLLAYVKARVQSDGRMFSELADLHRAATVALELRLKARDPDPLNEEFASLYPLRGDGTRRTSDRLFDGGEYGRRHIYGVAGFLPHAASMSRADKALFVSALEVVSQTGETAVGRYDNIYFFTPQTRMVMFAPGRPDRLMFYRKTAPPDLDISDEEMARIVLPANNPQGVMRCTRLQRLLSDPRGRRVNTACLTPVYIDGRFVGAWGTSLSLEDYLSRAVAEAVPGGRNMIASSNGELIAAQGLIRDSVTDPKLLRAAEAGARLPDLMKRIRADGRQAGILAYSRPGWLTTFARLPGPGWWLLISYPSSGQNWASLRIASWVLLFGVLGVIVQVLLLYRVIRHAVAEPLGVLAFARRKGDRDAAATIERRGDEIGALARALRAEHERNDELLRSLEDRVAERTEELEQANQAKSVFLANMSHELRTPLNGVIAIGDRLANEEDPDVRRELAQLVTSSGRLLEQVLGDILDVSKIEAGQFQLTPAPFDLQRLVRGMAELHAAAAQAKGLRLEWSVTPQAEGSYLGDAGRISQILSNLLANAVKFTAQGEITLSVERRDETLVFTVADTGLGFDDTVRERLFKRFVQADQSITRQFGGTGLGLSISAALAEMMGGRIDARAVVGAGATFSVELPLPRCDDAAVDADAGVEDEISLEGLRVLVAEDHPTNRKVVEVVLEPFGVDLTLVEDGAAALVAVEREVFDAILMDMQMPVMDGLTATRAIREREAALSQPPVLIIMLTANAMEEHVRSAYAAGADLHLAKPLHPGQLLSALAAARAGRPSP